MKKLMLSILFLSLSVLTLYSKEITMKPERKVRKFEMEFALGSSIGPFPSSDAGARIHEFSATIIEMRWNLRNKPIDIGTQWYIGGQSYEHPTQLQMLEE